MLDEALVAVRTARRQWGWSSLVVGTLTVTMAAVAGIFGAIDRVVWSPLAAAQGEDLVFVYAAERGRSTAGTYRELRLLSQATEGEASWTASQSDSTVLQLGVDRTRIFGERVVSNYFAVILPPFRLGRGLDPDAGSAATEPEVVISERLWRRLFHGTEDVLSKTFTIATSGQGRRHYRVVGVVSGEFRGVGSPWVTADYWMPAEARIADLVGGSRSGALDMAAFEVLVGRKARTVPTRLIETVVQHWASNLSAASANDRFPRQTYPRTVRESQLTRLPFSLGPFSPEATIGLVIALAGAVFAVGLLNLSGLMAARGVARQAELRCRSALGATHARLAKLLAFEVGVLAIGAGLLALALAPITSAALISSVPAAGGAWLQEPVAHSEFRSLFGGALVFAMASASTAALGLAPLIGLGKSLASSALGIASVPPRLGRTLNGWIVFPQVVVASALSVVAAAAVTEWTAETRRPLGYDAHGLYSAELEAGRTEDVNTREFMTALETRFYADGIALANTPPTSAKEGMVQTPEGQNNNRSPERASINRVSPGYFSTVGLGLSEGRVFSSSDAAGSVAMVDKALANRLWPQEGAVGQYLRLGSGRASPTGREQEDVWLQVVGVTQTLSWPVRAGLAEGSVFVPARFDGLEMTVLVRSSQPPSTLAETIRGLAPLAGHDVGLLPVIRTVDAIREQRYPHLVVAAVLLISASQCLALAVFGTFSVASYSVRRRTREFAIRVALGANRRDVFLLVVMEGLGWGLAGSLFGAGLGIVLSNWLASVVPGVGSLEILTTALACCGMTFAVVAAYALPAASAAKTNPIVLLKDE